MKSKLSILLIAVMLLNLLAGCSVGKSNDKNSEGTHVPKKPKVQIDVDEDDSEEQLVELQYEEANAAIMGNLNAFDSQNMTEDQQIVEMEAFLQQLCEEGIIENPCYTEESNAFEFQYTDGSYGILSMEPMSYETIGIGGGDVTRSNWSGGQYVPDVTGTGTELSAVVYDAVDEHPDFQNSAKRIRQTFIDAGTDVYMDNHVTVENLLHFDLYDIIVLYAHGTFYTTKEGETISYFLLDEMKNDKTKKTYKEDFRAGRIKTQLSRFKDENGELESWHNYYVVLPSFFEAHYAEGSLEGKVIIALSCRLFGDDRYAKQDISPFADVFVNKLGAELMVGFHNSVSVEYGTDYVDGISRAMLLGYNAQEAFEIVKEACGEQDRYKYDGNDYSHPAIRVQDPNYKLVDTALEANDSDTTGGYSDTQVDQNLVLGEATRDVLGLMLPTIHVGNIEYPPAGYYVISDADTYDDKAVVVLHWDDTNWGYPEFSFSISGDTMLVQFDAYIDSAALLYNASTGELLELPQGGYWTLGGNYVICQTLSGGAGEPSNTRIYTLEGYLTAELNDVEHGTSDGRYFYYGEAPSYRLYYNYDNPGATFEYNIYAFDLKNGNREYVCTFTMPYETMYTHCVTIESDGLTIYKDWDFDNLLKFGFTGGEITLN